MTTNKYPDILKRFTPEPDMEVCAEKNDEIIFANVGVNKVISNPNDKWQPRNCMFETVEIKKSGPLIIHGKRWYFRLVSAKHGENKKSRALMDDYQLNDIARHMVVCYTPDKIPGQTKPFRTKEGKHAHIFAYFDSYLEFYDYLMKFSHSDRSFYEVIFGELPQKPHFDIDISIKDLDSMYPGEDINKVAEILLEHVIHGCIEVLADNSLTLDLSKDVLYYSSHGPTKGSFHIVLNGRCCDGHKEAKAFYDAVMNKVRVYTGGKYLDFIDKSVYGPRQQFRIMGCQKVGSNRPKIYYQVIKYQGVEYKHIYNEDVSDLAVKKLAVLYESLVSFISGCVFLPSLIPPKPMNQINYADMPDVSETVAQQCLQMMREKMAYSPFSIKEVRGHLILLNRLAPSLCPICQKKQPHESEHPYIFIAGGKVYWDCRRAPDNAGKFFLGYLAMTIDEMQSSCPMLTLDENEMSSEEDDGGDIMFGDFNMGQPTLTPQKKVQDVVVKKDVAQVKYDTIPAELRIQNLHSVTMNMALKRAQDRYLKSEPIDVNGTRSIASTTAELQWSTRLK